MSVAIPFWWEDFHRLRAAHPAECIQTISVIFSTADKNNNNNKEIDHPRQARTSKRTPIHVSHKPIRLIYTTITSSLPSSPTVHACILAFNPIQFNPVQSHLILPLAPERVGRYSSRAVYTTTIITWFFLPEKEKKRAAATNQVDFFFSLRCLSIVIV